MSHSSKLPYGVFLLAISFFSCNVFAVSFVSDDFDAPNLNTKLWTFVSPRDDTSLSMNGGQLSIAVPGNTSHDAWTDGIYTPRIMQSVDNTDFELEIKFASQPSKKYQQQGIMIQQDNDNFMRFEFYHDGAKLHAYVASFAQRSPTVQVDDLITGGTTMYMRVKRTGDQWTQSYSYDGTTWVSETAFAHSLNVSQIGVYVGNSDPTAPAYTGVIDYFFNTASPIVPEDGKVAPDTLPPLIHHVYPIVNTISTITNTDSVNITWATDEPANGKVEYGTTTSYGSLLAHTDFKSSHNLLASGLAPNTTYHFRVTSVDTSGKSSISKDYTFITSPNPVLNVWYGDTQPFGHIGQPQKWVNILGNVTDPDGIASLTYSLNGQAAVNLSMGPDLKRLVAPGDFNVDLAYSDLQNSINTVMITAKDTLGHQTVKTININYSAGNVWPIPYTVDWSKAGSSPSGIQNIAQVVDGQWKTDNTGIRTVELGYDRNIALGDISWTNYEVTVPVTVHGIDPVCVTDILNCLGEPSIGIVVRWQGHYDVDGTRPYSGYVPVGASGGLNWYRNDLNHAHTELDGSQFEVLATGSKSAFTFETNYIFKLRAETIAGQGHFYRLKVWENGSPEPAQWELVGQEPITELANGAVLLTAHHVDATFGNISVTNLPADITPPKISNVTATAIENSAVITWDTDEPADSVVAYGTTNAYEKGIVPDTKVGFSHSIALSGLTPGITYHYQVKSTDSSKNSASSSDFTFITKPAPVADAQKIATLENKPLSITLTGSDADGDIITFKIASNPTHGTLSGTVPNLTYTPNKDYIGSDSFTFIVNDGAVDSAPATVAIDVKTTNHPPVADTQNDISVDENKSVSINLTGSDIDGDALHFSIATTAAHGTLSGTVPNLTYTPNTDYSGTDSFTFVANDGIASSPPATVAITVNKVDSPPVVTTPPPSSSSGGSSGGCSISLSTRSGEIDPILPSLILLSFTYIILRRRKCLK